MLAIIDQMVLSLASLGTSVLVGRIAGPAVLGQYTVGFSVAVILSCLIRALIVGPLSVYLFRAEEDQRASMKAAMVAQAAAAILLLVVGGGTLALCGGWVANHWNGGASVDWFYIGLALTLAISGVVSREVVRQAKFAHCHFESALLTDVVATALQVGLLVFLWQTERLTPVWLFSTLGIASWLASGAWWARELTSESLDLHDAWRRWSGTWRFGRWEAIGQSCQVIQGYALSWILAATGGFAAAGLYAAAWSIVQLVSPFAQGAGNAVGPLLARAYANRGLAALRSQTNKLTGLAALACLAYVLGIVLLGPWLMHLAYGSQYGNPSTLLIVLALSVTASISTMATLKAIIVLERPKWLCLIQALVLVLILAIASGLGSVYGMIGAAVGLMISQGIGAIAKVVAFGWATRQTAATLGKV